MKRSAIILSIVLALLCAAGIAAWIWLRNTAVTNATAEIYSDGELIKTVSLSEDTRFTVDHGDGYNVIEVQDGAVSVVEASCPDKVCIHTGAVSQGAVPIICLPNRLEVKVISTDNNVDAVIN